MNAISESQLWKKRLGDWVINPYVGCMHGCKFCYCPAMPGVKFFNGGKPQSEWGNYVQPKEGLMDALRRQLKHFTPEKAKRTEWGNGWVLMSFLTDCYQPIEARLKLTRECLKLLLEAGHKVRIQTRSAMVKRDFDILYPHRDRVLLGVSIPSTDEEITRVLEPKAASLKRRWEVIEQAAASDIPVYVAVAPVMPWTGSYEFEEILSRASNLLPREIFCEVLNPKGSNLDIVESTLDKAGMTGLAACSRRYGEGVWAERTFNILEQGYEWPNFVPWPDTGRAWRKHLPAASSNWLEQFLPKS